MEMGKMGKELGMREATFFYDLKRPLTLDLPFLVDIISILTLGPKWLY